MNEKDINVFDDEVIEKNICTRMEEGERKMRKRSKEEESFVPTKSFVFAIILKPLSISFI